MKVFIAIDLEGISGVVAERDVDRDGSAAVAARVNMAADLDAVVEGCLAAGAAEIVVCDAHDDGRNLDASGLPDGVTLVSGSPTPYSMLQGLGRGYDGAQDASSIHAPSMTVTAWAPVSRASFATFCTCSDVIAVAHRATAGTPMASSAITSFGPFTTTIPIPRTLSATPSSFSLCCPKSSRPR